MRLATCVSWMLLCIFVPSKIEHIEHAMLSYRHWKELHFTRWMWRIPCNGFLKQLGFWRAFWMLWNANWVCIGGQTTGLGSPPLEHFGTSDLCIFMWSYTRSRQNCCLKRSREPWLQLVSWCTCKAMRHDSFDDKKTAGPFCWTCQALQASFSTQVAWPLDAQMVRWISLPRNRHNSTYLLDIAWYCLHLANLG